MDKEHVYINHGILLGHEKDKIWPHMTMWMGLESFMLNEISDRKKNQNDVISLICGI